MTQDEESSAITFRNSLPVATLTEDRTAWLLGRCSGAKVLHIGCVDSGYTGERIRSGELLHSRLLKVTKGLVGVDVDAGGIEKLKGLGLEGLLLADVSTSVVETERFVRESMGGCDIILCGEVIEHVLDMGRFLSGVRSLAEAFGAAVILTAPNAFSIRGMAGVLAGVEIVHPDHKCYLSWKTLDTLLLQSGFRVEQTLFYSNENAPESRAKRLLKGLFNRSLLRWRPQLAEGLIVIARVP